MCWVRPLKAGLPLLPLALLAGRADGAVHVQCPGDLNGDAVIDVPDPAHPKAVCKHLGAGDGFVRMADGKLQYIFGFVDLTGTPPDMAMHAGMLGATFPAPTLVVKEGDELYLTLTNVGMMMRPDLFDPHSVHWHGFPQAAPIFDGEPMASISINMGSSLTYYYQVVEPGTYMYHCHVEATEHMQMGMLGNLYVEPAQNGTPYTYQGKTYTKFVHNDGDGSTGYDVEFPIQLGSFDPDFHDASMEVQPLPFAAMRDRYAMLNGRGYPDTLEPGDLVPPEETGGKPSQRLSSLVTAVQGETILLRISNLNITRFYTLATLGLKMRVVASNAKLLRGINADGSPGQDLSHETASVTLGGGEAVDVLIDTRGITPGTYFLYTTNLNYLSNDLEDFGGMMTEIRIAPARRAGKTSDSRKGGTR